MANKNPKKKHRALHQVLKLQNRQVMCFFLILNSKVEQTEQQHLQEHSTPRGLGKLDAFRFVCQVGIRIKNRWVHWWVKHLH